MLKKITTTFEKSLFLIEYRMRYAIYMPPNTKDLTMNQTMVAYGNGQNATAFARANNSELLRSLKHLTRLQNAKSSNHTPITPIYSIFIYMNRCHQPIVRQEQLVRPSNTQTSVTHQYNKPRLVFSIDDKALLLL